MEHPGRLAFHHAIRGHHRIDMLEAALAVAQEDLDLFEVDTTRAALGRLAERVAAEVGPVEPSVVYAERLIRYLHTVEGFAGNTVTYHDPAHSYLPLVCERRQGLPLTLTLVLLAVARPNGVPLEPAGLPQHFMARWPLPDGSLFLDLFWGQVLDARGCRIFLQGQAGTALPDPDLFPPTPPHEVVARLLRNLKNSYVRRRNFPMALRACERLLLVAPDSLEDVRDRGSLRLSTGDLHRGLDDLERYAAAQPKAFDQQLLRKQAQSAVALLRGRS